MDDRDITARFTALERKLAAIRWRLATSTMSTLALALALVVSCHSKPAPTPAPTNLELEDGDRSIHLSADGVVVRAGARSTLLNADGMFVDAKDPKLGGSSTNYRADGVAAHHEKGAWARLEVDELGGRVEVVDPSEVRAKLSASQGEATVQAAKSATLYARLSAGRDAPDVRARNDQTTAHLAYPSATDKSRPAHAP